MRTIFVKEKHQSGNNQGALYHLDPVTKTAKFGGNVVTSNLGQYLQENPDVRVANCIPEGYFLDAGPC